MNRKFAILSTMLFLTACGTNSIPGATVKITNKAGTSGGSGSVIATANTHSEILTNAHVCELAKNGAVVHTISGKVYPVIQFRVSALHDLCLISIASKLDYTSSLAMFPPAPYESISVSGHPRLLPTMVVQGNLSEKEMIQVVIGERACTELDMQDPTSAFFCALIGKLPVIKNYEAIAMSALIQPGSSGSGVYNRRGEVVAVAFAGNGDLSYGFSVPYEYIYYFLNIELKNLPVLRPSDNAPAPSDHGRATIEKFREVCSTVQSRSLKEFCKVFTDTAILY